MKIKKYINTKNLSRILAFGILLNNLPINSFAGVLSEDSRYETFNSDNIVIPDVLEDDEVDVEIEGNTLVNALKYESKSDFAWLSGSVDENGYIEIEAESDKYKNFFMKKESVIVKPSTTYTFFLEIVENTLIRDDGGVDGCFAFGGTNNVSNISYWKTAKWFKGGTTGRHSFTLETKDDFSNATTGDRGYINLTTTGKIKFRYMIIEGDHTDKDIYYFKGIKSVGELENNTLELVSRNKNLWDGTYESGSIYTGENDLYPGEDSDLGINRKRSYYIPVKPNTTYTISQKEFLNAEQSEIYIHQYNKYKKNILWGEGLSYRGVKQKLTFTTDSDTHYLRFRTQNNRVLTPDAIMLEEGNIATNIMRQYSNKKVIQLNGPLRSLPNGIKDKVIKINNKWYIERNCGQMSFTGIEQWKTHGNLTSDNIAYFVLVNNHENNVSFNGNTSNIRADKLLDLSRVELGEFSNTEGISLHSNNGNISWYSIGILKSKLSTVDIANFKQWLSVNPIKIVYQLDNPIYELIEFDSLKLYLDTTYISTKSTIPANLKVTVDRVANRAKEYSELAKSNPTIENISLARMWTNLMRESILKDEFQNNVDNITEITDMSLERQIASTNVDVYIKSENMLSISLNTNSITFEDFSGAEDLIKENAVSISINSSLPYNLNAHLATEIQNNDKSNTMDLDVLSIKDDSELNYQTFSSINNKLTLKNNCDNGNNKQHNINLKLNGGIAHEKDVYKTTIKFEAEQI